MRTRSLNPADHGLNHSTWTLTIQGTDVLGQCTLCDADTEKKRRIWHCKEHEGTRQHREKLRDKQRCKSQQSSNLPAWIGEGQLTGGLEDWTLDRGTMGLLASIQSRYSKTPPPYSYPIEQETFGVHHDASLPHDLPEPLAEGIADFTQSLMNMSQLPEPEDEPDDSGSESSDSESEPDAELEDVFGVDQDYDPLPDLGADDPNHSRKRQRTDYSGGPAMSEWYPWPDRITCTLDMLMHLPCSVFSQRQLDLFLWLLAVNGVNDVPSVYQMKTINEKLQQWVGIETTKKVSPFGNVYYQNSFAQILAQEMANPNVRPALSTLPEDSSKRVSEAWHGQRWAEEIPDDVAPPMIRLGSKDYYIFEPTVIWNHPSAEYCIPFRWFTRGRDVFARCYNLYASADGWIVLPEVLEVHESQLLMNFEDFCRNYPRDNVPVPRTILGMWDEQTRSLSPWEYPTSGNPWRDRAKGRRVLSVPIWLYCDDTSGNVSKKWNKHNSFLFTLAGLERSESQKDYHVHFLCTSNIAGPLEMLDGVAEQIEQAQAEGIEAWDCVYGEDILVLPWTLALLGDNPMQSEFAAHIGLRGKFFCRVCKVKGKDSADQPQEGPQPEPVPDSRPASPVGSTVGDDNEGGGTEGKRKKIVETFDQVKQRFVDFMKVGELRTKLDSRRKLRAMFDAVVQGGPASHFDKETTATGLKDGFLHRYVKQIVTAAGRLRTDRRGEAIRSCIASFPEDVTSPVWRLKELDPHQDTPVEILHVVLLGFVKYMWRDVVQVQLKNKTPQLDLLKNRLSSFDTSGLGILPLNGNTLVQFAGSLVGRDFRTIAQVAPFVLYDLVSDESYQTWLCLSKLIPLIWQPVIENIDEYCETLKAEINVFLLRTAKWSGRWFNKPKFHILLHLPDHIRRFGPAILFATEAFESFNAIIRAKSVHSNRQAPSRDIALAFAQGNRIRHLLSRGMFREKDSDGKLQPGHRWIGPGPQRLMDGTKNIVREYLGIPSHSQSAPAARSSGRGQTAPVPFNRTKTYWHYPSLSIVPSENRQLARVHQMKDVSLSNGDTCTVNMHAIIHDPKNASLVGRRFVGRIEEMARKQDLSEIQVGAPTPDWILVEVLDHRLVSVHYDMPSLQCTGRFIVVSIQDILGVVNAPHDCKSNGCELTGQHVIYQERLATDRTLARVEHRSNPNQRILNLAQMRSSAAIAWFRRPPVPYSDFEWDTIVHESAFHEHQSQHKHRKKSGPRPISRPTTPVFTTPSSTIPSSAARAPNMPASNTLVSTPSFSPTFARSTLALTRPSGRPVGVASNMQFTIPNRPGVSSNTLNSSWRHPLSTLGSGG
ncbi:hypothetical protein PQX77_001159 [Marasmius sp. AFHP31]|nr:hypothetical protein PQX77_001159 [Marasmius sp. AFHP31]